MSTYYSNGKLLLTGEYVVLDGALSLALPTKYGQYLDVEPINLPKIIWRSFDNNNAVWFEDTLDLNLNTPVKDDTSKRLIQILKAVKTLTPNFLNSDTGFKISTRLNFNRHWGLGTSSTLINNVAQWANVDPYKLLELTFGGSGYDIACASNNLPIFYQIKNQKPIIKTVAFNPLFKSNLYFVYLNKKQNSRAGIATYQANKKNIASKISDINSITEHIITCKTLECFETLINKHEAIIAKITQQETLKNKLFKDFNGSIKSLGAWGGDFILATSKENPTTYFKSKGFNTVFSYADMVLAG